MSGSEVRSQGESVDRLLGDLAEIVRELSGAGGLDEVLQRVVDRAASFIDGCSDASIAFIKQGGLTTPAATSHRAYRLDSCQPELGEGPCVAALEGSPTAVIDDVRSHDRWASWLEVADDAGIRSTMGVRLFVDGDTMGALNLYSESVASFDQEARAIADVFAAFVSVAIKTAINESGLERALASRDVIGQAKGILMERDRITGEAAFDRLRELSQQQGRRLAEVARDVSETGVAPLIRAHQVAVRAGSDRLAVVDVPYSDSTSGHWRRTPPPSGTFGSPYVDTSPLPSSDILDSCDGLARLGAVMRRVNGSPALTDALGTATKAATQFVPGVDHAVVVVRVAGRTTPHGATHGVARALADVQQQHETGPSIDALTEARPVVSEDLAKEQRWSAFTIEGLALGMRSVLAMPLYVSLDDRRWYGAMTMMGAEPGIDEHAIAVAGLLAAHVSVVVDSSMTRSTLEDGMDGRELIGRATGIMMQRLGVDQDQAMSMLRALSNERNITVRQLATSINSSTARPTST